MMRCCTNFRKSSPAAVWKSCQTQLSTQSIESPSSTIDIGVGRISSVIVCDPCGQSFSQRANVSNSLLDREIQKRPDKVRLHGRILFLTEDPDLIKKQLAGWDLPWDTKNPASNPKLRDDISTDEITPAHYCFYFDQTLGEIPYVGLRCGDTLPIGRGDVKKGGFVCSVSGKRRGKGSSREQSPYAEMCAGVQ